MVCKHPQIGRINYLLVTAGGGHGSGRRALAQKFGVNEGSIVNHAKNHISEEFRRTVLVGPLTAEAVTDESKSILANLCAVYNGHYNQWQIALELGADEKMVQHAKVMANIAWRLAQLTHAVAPLQHFIQNNTVQIFDQPEYVNTITAVTTALVAHPEARQAVVEALRAVKQQPKQIEMTKH
jgi:hypothetical protein